MLQYEDAHSFRCLPVHPKIKHISAYEAIRHGKNSYVVY